MTSVAVFCMHDRGHFQRLRGIIAGFAAKGTATHVFTGPRFRDDVESIGGRFVDLMAMCPVAGVDDESWPEPVRFTAHAARYAEQLVPELSARGVSLVLHDTFAVIGGAVAHAMGIPHVNVCAGHDAAPARLVPFLESHPLVRVSSRCHEAVETLRARFGMANASPFSYVTAFSPYLNLYCEPPEFLDEAARGPYQPIAFFGSLPSPEVMRSYDERTAGLSYFGPSAPSTLKVYISFGTVIWDYRRAEAQSAMTAISRRLAAMPDVQVIAGLGGAVLDDDARGSLRAVGATVVDYVEQWAMLREADLFVTHHGLNSTHEAIFQGVPMLSYPFAWDQPGQADVCQRMGVALPIVDRPMAPVTDDDVTHALETFRERRPAMREALGQARAREQHVIDGRDRLFDRMLDLAEPSRSWGSV